MKLFTTTAAALVCAAALSAQPKIDAGGVTNAASYALQGLPNAGIARGSVFAIKGSGLGPAEAKALPLPTDESSYPLPLQLDGTAVKVTVNGSTVDAFVVYTSAKQVRAVLPSNAPEGDGTVTVTYNGETSASAAVKVVRASFGAFTTGQTGSGTAFLQNVKDGEKVLNGLTQPAQPGQQVILFGTGLGPVEGDEAAGPVAGDIAGDVTVWVGGKTAEVASRGRTAVAGVDQITFTVPEGVDGCYVPVAVKAGDIVSNVATLAIAQSGGCKDVSGISGDEILSASANGVYRIGYISLNRTASKMTIPELGTMDSKTDSGSAMFMKYDLTKLSQSTGLAGGVATSLGACNLMTFRISDDGQTPVDPFKADMLDAGPVINVTGPKGSKQLKKHDGMYSGELGGGMSIPLPFPIPGMPGASPDFLEAGDYRIDNGSGGSGSEAVGAFTARLTMGQPLVWTNESRISDVTRSEGQEITWTGGDPNGYVHITGMSFNDKVAGMFVCTEKTSAGKFTVPSYVLANLPATKGEIPGSLGVDGVTASAKFTAPGLDAGYVSASAGTQKSVSYK